jgi:hypothetical protein
MQMPRMKGQDGLLYFAQKLISLLVCEFVRFEQDSAN